jgi:SAM-dependent methyltransferase
MIQMFAFRVLQAILTAKRNSIIRAHLPSAAKKIVDVGCGHFPSRFANVAMDRAANDDDEQRGGLTLSSEKAGIKFFDVDLNHFPYPFSDNEFDYLICTHVLEHLDDPVRACSEFARIARAGYLEVPYFCADAYVRNNDLIHRWLCMYSPSAHMLSFTNRDILVRDFPPLYAELPVRFVLQLRNVPYTWSGSINAEYWALTPKPIGQSTPGLTDDVTA